MEAAEGAEGVYAVSGGYGGAAAETAVGWERG